MPYQGGTPRLIKSLPCAKNFFFNLTNDIFVICNLKVIKNNKHTYDNMHFEKQLPKKCSVHISGYIPPTRQIMLGLLIQPKKFSKCNKSLTVRAWTKLSNLYFFGSFKWTHLTRAVEKVR